MKAICYLSSLLFFITGFSQVGISTEPHARAALEIASDNKGVLIPRLTDSEMNAIATPANSLMVFNTTRERLMSYNSATLTWLLVSSETVAAISATSYILTEDDNGRILDFTATTAVAVAVPSNLPIGFRVNITQAGIGTITIGGQNGMLVNNRAGFVTSAGQYAKIGVEVRASNSAILSGDVRDLPTTPPPPVSVPILNQISDLPSFAFSLRKLRTLYNGFSVRVRRSVDNAEADISFDSSDIVSTSSTARIAVVGTSPFIVGQTMTYAIFATGGPFFVSVFYDQSTFGVNAVQTVAGAQPQLILNSAGVSNNKPSILFEGITRKDKLTVNEFLINLLPTGRGSFFMYVKPTRNSSQGSFGGFKASPQYSWSMHFNWHNQNLFFDAGESCCSPVRNIINSDNIGRYSQYSFIRGNTYKLVKRNEETLLPGAAVTAAIPITDPIPTTRFALGGWDGVPVPAYEGFSGNLAEAILYPNDLTNTHLHIVEKDQNRFWY